MELTLLEIKNIFDWIIMLVGLVFIMYVGLESINNNTIQFVEDHLFEGGEGLENKNINDNEIEGELQLTFNKFKN